MLAPSSLGRWAVTGAATAASAVALDATATAVGVVLVAAHVLVDAPWLAVIGFLAATYGLWAVGLRSNLTANAHLLEATGTSTNVLSKLFFDAARRRAWTSRGTRNASAAGYVVLEVAKEVPYYAGAFGSALLTPAVGAAEAIVFLGGTNLGAACYELTVSRLTHRGLAWRSNRVVQPPATGPVTVRTP